MNLFHHVKYIDVTLFLMHVLRIITVYLYEKECCIKQADTVI